MVWDEQREPSYKLEAQASASVTYSLACASSLYAARFTRLRFELVWSWERGVFQLT